MFTVNAGTVPVGGVKCSYLVSELTAFLDDNTHTHARTHARARMRAYIDTYIIKTYLVRLLII